MIPNKLQKGDEIRVIAPSRSMKIIGNDSREIANKRFSDMGFNLTFGKNVELCDEFTSYSIEARL